MLICLLLGVFQFIISIDFGNRSENDVIVACAEVNVCHLITLESLLSLTLACSEHYLSVMLLMILHCNSAVL